MAALLDHLDGIEGWSELVFPMISRASPSLEALVRAARARGWHLRIKTMRSSRVVRLDGGFETYLRSLSHKTRRRLFNQRKRLEDLGRVEFKHVAWDEGADLIQEMNRFRARRKAGEALGERTLEFHRVLATRLPSLESTRLSCLCLDGVPASVNYALRMKKREYGIQMGFDPSIESRLSLGLLHLGYALEAAAADGITRYDLMTGMGPGPDWKDSIANDEIELVSVQVLRGKMLSCLYGTFDRLGERTRSAP
jgi:CelD/BcsL family acetyltransferase involved in cellulose biosynthesis